MAAKRRKLRVVRGEERYPFVLGDIVEVLQGTGVPTDDAVRIARDCESYFSEGKKSIAMDDLLQYLAAKVGEQIGPDAAGRLLAQTPPFVPISVVRSDDEEIFSERLLLGVLEKLDLSFKEAFALARHVGAVLRAEGYERIDERELSHRVALALETRFGHELRLHYEATVADPTAIQVIERDGGRLPFSRGILAQSLLAIGLGPELAYTLAKRTEDALWRLGLPEVPRERVRNVVSQLLLEEAGEAFSQRYDLLRAVRRPDRPVVVLIGGAPGIGKSTVASELAYRLGIRRMVSTDAVRQALRSLISPELSPVLHSSSYTAWRAELLPAERATAVPKRKGVIRGFQAQVQQLRPALSAIVERNIREATSLVMEGIHLVPGISPEGLFDGATVVELVFKVEGEHDHARNFGLREAQTAAKRGRQRYTEHLTEIRMLQGFIVGMAQEAEVQVIDSSDMERAVDQAIDHVLDELLADGVVAGDESPAEPGPVPQ